MVTESLAAPHSHYLFDAKLSQEIDRRTIDEMGIDGFTLMEVAGSSAAKYLLQDYSELTHGVFLCGKGNNAGDALVVARYLLQHQIQATVVFISGSDELSADTKKNLRLLQQFDTQKQLTVYRKWQPFSEAGDADFIVDGMLGTGLNSDLRGDYTKAVRWANDRNLPIFSMDIPTGLHAESGRVMGSAVKANSTFAFGGQKLGFFLQQGSSVTGKIHYCELPFPTSFMESCRTFLLDENWVPSEPPKPAKHKYDSGVLYIIAGSEGLTGAAMMAAKSAWAEGLGAVILICPRGILPIYEQSLPSIIKKPVGSREDFFFKQEHSSEVLSISQEKDGSVLLGPGLGREKATVQFVESFLAQNTTDIIIDADGLWCLSQIKNWKKHLPSNCILTPHPGELSQLLDKKIEDDEQRLKAIQQLVKDHHLTLLSKGMPGIVGTPLGKTYLTNYDTHYFARAGSGDVLAGKVAAYLTMNHAPDSACAQGLLNGKKKLDHFLNHNSGLPEPKHFI